MSIMHWIKNYITGYYYSLVLKFTDDVNFESFENFHWKWIIVFYYVLYT